MKAHLCLVALVVCFVTSAPAQVGQRGPIPRELKPQWQRMLTAGDAKKATELETRIADAEAADKRDEAMRLAEELLALRVRVQGSDHWEAVTVRWQLDADRTVAALPAARRAEWTAIRRGTDRAHRLEDEDRYAEAQPLWEARRKWCEQVFGERHVETAAVYNFLGLNLLRQAKLEEAKALIRRALDIRLAVLGEAHPITAHSFNNLAGITGELGKYADAQPHYERALQSYRALYGDRHEDVALGFNNLALNLTYQGRYADADTYYRKALDLRRELLGEKHRDTATSYASLAFNLGHQGKHADAQPLFEKALDQHSEAYGPRHPRTGDCHGLLAGCLNDQGQYGRAEPYARRALEIARAGHGDSHPDTGRYYGLLALTLDAQGRSAEAEPFFARALDITRAALGEKHPLTAGAYNDRGFNLTNQKKYAPAEAHLRTAAALSRELLGEKHADTALHINNLAACLNGQRKYAEAEDFYRQSLEIRRAVFGDRHMYVANSHCNLANNFDRQNNFQAGYDHYAKALDLLRDLLGEAHPHTALMRVALAENLTARGQRAAARRMVRAAAASYESARLGVAGRGLDRAAFGARRSPYPLLAALEAAAGSPATAWLAAETDLARGLADEAADLARPALPAADRQSADRLGKLRERFAALAGKAAPTEAEQTELAALRAERADLEARLGRLAVDRSRQEVVSLTRVQAALPPDAGLVLWVDLDVAGIQEHWGCVVRRTGDPRWERLSGGKDGTWSKGDNEVTRQLLAALRGKSATAPEINGLSAQARAQRIAPLQKHLDGVKRLLVVGTNQMAGVPVELVAPEYQVEYVPSGTAVARAAARPKLAGPTSVLVVGDPDFRPTDAGVAKEPPLPPGGLLITAVVPGGAAFNVLKPGDVLLAYAGTDLADVETLGKAIAANAGAKTIPTKVWRVTDQGVALTRMVDLTSGRLGVNLANEPARKLLTARYKADGQLAAVARSGQIDPKTGQKVPWKELPGTAVELDRLNKLFGDKATILSRSAASEQKLNELRAADKLNGYRYLHFATHGLANDEKAFESFLVLAQDGLPRYGGKEGEKHFDGELSAREVLDDWKLDNCDLVTLSACESGLGRAAGGDGLLGFTQAFLVAGARSVCLSLWEVDDTATCLLMDRLYRNLLGQRDGLKEPMRKGAALREAKSWLKELTAEEVLKLSADMTNGVTRGKGEPLRPVVEAKAVAPDGNLKAKPYADPRYWAAFIIVGDPD